MAQDEAETAAGGHLATALDLLDEGVLALDDELRVLEVNESALRLLGVDRSALDAPRWWELVRPRLADGRTLDFPRTRRVRVRDLRVRIRRARDGRSRDLIVHHQPLAGGGCVIAFRDCTEERRTRRRLEAIALRDAVTDLPNRLAALRALDEALDERSPFALLLVDVDGFRTINTGLGQSAGDSVLREIAGRLRGALPRAVRLSRFGSDDFLILAHGGESGARAIAERVRDAFSAPFVAGQGAHLTASIGIVTHDAADEAASLVAAAETALVRARARGRGLVELFDDALRRSTDDRLALIADLRRAIDRDAIAVAYQPIVGLDPDGGVRLVGVEALARWAHPTRGAIPPGVFVALAEDAGLVRALGRRVLARACSEIAALRTSMPRQAGDLELAVNVSPRQVATGLLEHDVRAALSISRLPPRTLGLELTETALMDDAGPRVESLMALRSTGVRLVIDDFGTGYSSLARLRRLPLDGLKIDRSFVSGLGSVAVDTAIVEAVLAMASALRLPVVAEGVETREQSRILRSLGCPRAQGFLHGRPMGLDELRLRLSSEEWALRAVRVSG